MVRRWVAGPESDGQRVSSEDGRASYTFTDCEMSICRSAQLASYTGVDTSQLSACSTSFSGPATSSIVLMSGRYWTHAYCCTVIYGFIRLEQGAHHDGATAGLHKGLWRGSRNRETVA